MAQTHAERVGAAVRAEMTRRKITQAEVSACIGLTQQAVSRRLAGQVPFDVNELAKIADYLGLDIATLVKAKAA